MNPLRRTAADRGHDLRAAPDREVTPTPEGEPPQREMALGLRTWSARGGGRDPARRRRRWRPSCRSLLDPGRRRLPVRRTRPRSARPTASTATSAPARSSPSSTTSSWRWPGPPTPRGLPILAICRGTQVLNVARGGTLHQHLPDVHAGEIIHRQRARAPSRRTGSRSGNPAASPGCSERTRTEVNSFHHQAIARLGDGLVITGRAPDGTVEAIEAIDREFVIGVQWHAETLSRAPSRPRCSTRSWTRLAGAARRRRPACA